MNPADVALNQFQRRRAWLAREGRPEAEQDARLRPWAAIALRAGAAIAAMPLDVQLAYEDYRRANCTDSTARACIADDLCCLPDALAALATARDKALDMTVAAGSDPEKMAKVFAEAQDLQVLAAYLGAPAYCPQAMQEAA